MWTVPLTLASRVGTSCLCLLASLPLFLVPGSDREREREREREGRESGEGLSSGYQVSEGNLQCFRHVPLFGSLQATPTQAGRA